MKSSTVRILYISVFFLLLTMTLTMFHIFARYSIRDFKGIFEKSIYILAYSSDEVYRTKVVNGKANDISIIRLIDNKPFSIGPGIFVNGDSVKLLLEKDGQTDYVEIPEELLAETIRLENGKWFVTDENGNSVLSNADYAIHPKWLFFENGKLFYTLADKLDDDYVLYYGTILPWYVVFGMVAIIIVFLTASNSLAFSFKHREEEIKNLKASMKKIAEGRKLVGDIPEELKAIHDLVEELRAVTQKNMKTTEKLKHKNEQLLSSLKFEKEIHKREMLNIYKIFGSLIEEKVHHTNPPMEKMMELALFVAQELGINDKEELYAIQVGLALHDLGLVEEDFNENPPHGKKHSLAGERYGKALKLSPLAIDIIKHHHEAYDGTGFPDGLKGEEISLRARIVSATIAYFEEKYKSKNTSPVKKLKENKRFDPKVLAVIEKWLVK